MITKIVYCIKNVTLQCIEFDTALFVSKEKLVIKGDLCLIHVMASHLTIGNQIFYYVKKPIQNQF
jgi:hypothetical protein